MNNKYLCYVVICLYVLSSQNTFAQKIEDKGLFNCNSLYVTNYDGQPTISEVILDNNGIPTGKLKKLYRTKDLTYASTIALGRPEGKAKGNSLRMYGWNYVGAVNFSYVDASGKQYPASSKTRFTTFAGGEVNQMTGEVYLSGDAVGYMSNIQYAIWDPIKDTTITSARGLKLKPGTVDRGVDAWKSYISSDMAIDAEGNFYSIVGKRWFLKVERGTNGQQWWAEEIGEFPDLILKASGNPVDGGALHDIWGMAFLNGKLYVSTYRKDIHVISPLTLKVIASSKITDNLGPGIDTIYDFAACQVAPVIRGTVYNDLGGSGDPKNFEPLGGQIVEIWRNGEYVTSRTTTATGEYVFLADNIDNAEYRLIIRNPKIDGRDAIQTWASAKEAINGTTALCSDGNNIIEKHLFSGVCKGYLDDKNDSVIRSDVIMSTDGIVAIADFAISSAKLTSERISIQTII